MLMAANNIALARRIAIGVPTISVSLSRGRQLSV
jgi:hypothetical protein